MISLWLLKFALAPFHQWNPLPDDLLESPFELKLLLLHTDSSHFTIHLDVLPTWILPATLIKQRWLRMRRRMFLELASKNRLQLCQASHCWWLPCARNSLISLVMQLVLESGNSCNPDSRVRAKITMKFWAGMPYPWLLHSVSTAYWWNIFDNLI